MVDTYLVDNRLSHKVWLSKPHVMRGWRRSYSIGSVTCEGIDGLSTVDGVGFFRRTGRAEFQVDLHCVKSNRIQALTSCIEQLIYEVAKWLHIFSTLALCFSRRASQRSTTDNRHRWLFRVYGRCSSGNLWSRAQINRWRNYFRCGSFISIAIPKIHKILWTSHILNWKPTSSGGHLWTNHHNYPTFPTTDYWTSSTTLLPLTTTIINHISYQY